MFSGIVECTAEVVDRTPSGTGGRLALRIPFAREIGVGESVAVNGCCLTVAHRAPEESVVAFDLLAQTLRVTNLGTLGPGDSVNVERALKAGDRLGGHFVQGHVDDAAAVIDFRREGADHRLEIGLRPPFRRWIIPRGSIAVDGISLTVAEVHPASFVCWIIPHTREVTNLSCRVAGDRVNVEFDLLGKYAARALEEWGRETAEPGTGPSEH